MAVNDIVMGAAGASGPATFVEDVFSTWLYSSTSGTDNTIVNNIDLSTKGGMVWVKSRTTGSTNNYVLDTVRGSSSGNSKELITNSTAAQNSGPYLDYMTFNNNGFTAKAVSGGGELGTNTYYGDFASWTFRKQPKFFDVVTYTGNGAIGRNVAHNLGSAPGCLIVKCTSSSVSWPVWHRATTGITRLDLTNAGDAGIGPYYFGDDVTTIAPTSTNFTVSASGGQATNASGQTYVAYLFAHNAGGFGATGTDNVISCGSYTGTGAAGNNITLGYEPQWLLIKGANFGTAWQIYDNMRGITTGGNDAVLYPNLSDAEDNTSGQLSLTATGFEMTGNTNLNASGKTYIYIAIRRPMKTPTTGTEVFSPVLQTGGGFVTTGFVTDMTINSRPSAVTNKYNESRLTGGAILRTDTTGAELAGVYAGFGYNNGYSDLNWSGAANSVYWSFKRAPGFFDEVCYTGTGVDRAVAHNLGVAPELIIAKSRNDVNNWGVYAASQGSSKYAYINNSSSFQTDSTIWSTTPPTASNFYVGTQFVNYSAITYVSYLFATVANVSKVGSYTGNGSSQTINCGFTTGARFFLVKATSTTGNWWVYDSSRGIISSNDPALALNSTAAEVTSADAVDADSSGIIVNQEATCSINASGVSYIFLAIA